jgi:hypothetical protein
MTSSLYFQTTEVIHIRNIVSFHLEHQQQQWKSNLVCRGRRCPNCKRCRDWHYNGNLNNDINRGTYNRKNWQRLEGATCRYHYDVCRFGDHFFEHRFRNFRDRDHQHFCCCNQNK